MTPYDPTLRIPEDRVATILARAVDIDRTTRETISVDALRTAALDAGISASALETALEEYASASVPADPADEPTRERPRRFGRFRAFLRKLVSPLRLGGIAFGVGMLAALGQGTIAIAVGLWGIMVVRLVLRYRPARRARGYVAHLALMTLGLTLGLAAGGLGDGSLVLMVPLGLAALLAGVAIVKVRLRRALPAAGA